MGRIRIRLHGEGHKERLRGYHGGHLSCSLMQSGFETHNCVELKIVVMKIVYKNYNFIYRILAHIFSVFLFEVP